MLTWVPSIHPDSHGTDGELAEESNFTKISVSKPKVMTAKIVKTIWIPFNIFGIKSNALYALLKIATRQLFSLF